MPAVPQLPAVPPAQSYAAPQPAPVAPVSTSHRDEHDDLDQVYRLMMDAETAVSWEEESSIASDNVCAAVRKMVVEAIPGFTKCPFKGCTSKSLPVITGTNGELMRSGGRRTSCENMPIMSEEGLDYFQFAHTDARSALRCERGHEYWPASGQSKNEKLEEKWTAEDVQTHCFGHLKNDVVSLQSILSARSVAYYYRSLASTFAKKASEYFKRARDKKRQRVLNAVSTFKNVDM